ncbi:MAG: T9SS type A sorting domain-containing protein [Flavobacteriales bacterium]|nr:T9SS type A sorting domain-containing protein [Flavobacteriales bacterium]
MESLKQAVNKPNFPMAMKAEVCIANPDATQKEGFIKWLELEANEPMPAYLIAMIEASWETKTFRTDMELELADLHTAICQRATEMLYVEHQKPVLSAAQLRWIWQQVRTTAARYAEANVLLAQGNFAAARTVIQDMSVDKALKAPEIVEQQRMLSYISILETAAHAGRGAHELVPSEVNQLKALIVEQYDRPANWVCNLLCLYYNDCRAPRTGGSIGGEKSLRPTGTSNEDIMQNVILIAPNPTQTWATVTYALLEEPINGRILVKDLFGRVVTTERMNGSQGQVVIDTRSLSKGVYVVECTSGPEVLRSERLIVQ